MLHTIFRMTENLFLQQQGLMVLSWSLQNDQEIVLEAVRDYSCALQYAWGDAIESRTEKLFFRQ